jgi:hypothetical protein
MSDKINSKTLDEVHKTFREHGIKCGGVNCNDCAMWSPVFKVCAFNIMNSCKEDWTGTLKDEIDEGLH